MHEGALRALEFDRIVEVVKSFALTPLGASQLAKLRPQTDMRSAQTALAATTECVTYLDSNNPFTLDCPPNIESILTNLAIEGLALDAGQLRGLADFLTSVETMQEAVIQAEAGPFPTLRQNFRLNPPDDGSCRGHRRQCSHPASETWFLVSRVEKIHAAGQSR